MLCLQCSNPLPATRKKYCSFECQNAAFSVLYSQRNQAFYYTNPKHCKHCSDQIPYEKRHSQFCGHSCAAKFNNTGRIRNLKSRHKTANSLRQISGIDWMRIQDYYNEGHSIKQCVRHFSISNGGICGARNRGEFITLPSVIFDFSTVLKRNTTIDRKRLKKHLIKAGLLPHKCSNCGQEPKWDNNPLVMVLDHINGINNDNRLENLRFLCPNCNSQTETFCRGGKERKPSIRAKDFVKALKATDTIKDALLSLGMEPNANSYARITKLLA